MADFGSRALGWFLCPQRVLTDMSMVLAKCSPAHV